jgi:hypothetical protein
VKNRLRWSDFGNIEDIIKWHNKVKPHGSLRENILETPMQDFMRKAHPKRKANNLIVEV